MRWVDTAVCLFVAFKLLRALLNVLTLTRMTDAIRLQREARRLRIPMRQWMHEGNLFFMQASVVCGYASARAQLPWLWVPLAVVMALGACIFTWMFLVMDRKRMESLDRRQSAREAATDWDERIRRLRGEDPIAAVVVSVLLLLWTYSWSHLMVGDRSTKLAPIVVGLVAVVALVIWFHVRGNRDARRGAHHKVDDLDIDIGVLFDLGKPDSALVLTIDDSHQLRLSKVGADRRVALAFPDATWSEQTAAAVQELSDQHGWMVERETTSDERSVDGSRVYFEGEAAAANGLRAILTRAFDMEPSARVHVRFEG